MQCYKGALQTLIKCKQNLDWQLYVIWLWLLTFSRYFYSKGILFSNSLWMFLISFKVSMYFLLLTLFESFQEFLMFLRISNVQLQNIKTP